MALSFGILSGIGGAFGWGIGDFLAKFSIDKIGPLRTFLWVQLLGLLALIALIPFFPFAIPTDWLSLGLILVAGLLNATSFLAFYRGFEVGKMSIVSPIAGSACAVTVILGILFLGEQLTQTQGIGVLLIIAGIIAASVNLREFAKKSKIPISAGVPEAVYSMFGWGIMWFVITSVERGTPWLPVMLGTRLIGFVLALILAAAKGGVIQKKKPLPVAAFSGSALFDVIGFVAVAAALTSNLSSIVVPVAHAYPAITVLLALIVLGEKPSKSQLIGAAAILAGIVAVSA